MYANFPGVDFLGNPLKFWEKEKEKFVFRLFTSSIKREIRHFHAVIVQWRQRNVQKSVLHVQSCFANQTYCFFDVLAAVVIAKAPFCLQQRRRLPKRQSALLQTLSRLIHVAQFVKCFWWYPVYDPSILICRWSSNFVENVVLERGAWRPRCHLVPPTLCLKMYGGWIWVSLKHQEGLANSIFARASYFFVHFFAGIARI